MLGDVVVIGGRWRAVVLLHHDDIILAEGVVHPAFLGFEIHLAALSVIVVDLEHSGEDAVVIFPEQLRDDHFIDAHGSTNDEIV